MWCHNLGDENPSYNWGWIGEGIMDTAEGFFRYITLMYRIRELCVKLVALLEDFHIPIFPYIEDDDILIGDDAAPLLDQQQVPVNVGADIEIKLHAHQLQPCEVVTFFYYYVVFRSCVHNSSAHVS